MRTLQFVLAVGALSLTPVAFAASGAAPASTPAPAPAAAPAPAPHTAAPAVDYAARCTALAGQWDTAAAANATNKNLGKAKAKADKAKTQCASTKASDQKKGVAGYEAALKLLGVTPS